MHSRHELVPYDVPVADHHQTSPHLAAACGPEPLSRDGWDIDGGLYKPPHDEFGRIVMDWRSMGQVPMAPGAAGSGVARQSLLTH